MKRNRTKQLLIPLSHAMLQHYYVHAKMYDSLLRAHGVTSRTAILIINGTARITIIQKLPPTFQNYFLPPVILLPVVDLVRHHFHYLRGLVWFLFPVEW